jgi:hypothetical protein
MSMNFNWELDQQCFDSLFAEFEASQLPLFDEEHAVKSYRTIDDKHLTKNGFITEIIIGVQKMFKYKSNDENIKFDAMVSRAQSTAQVFKTAIKDNFKCIDLWSVHLENSENFEVDYYTLKKLQSK